MDEIKIDFKGKKFTVLSTYFYGMDKKEPRRYEANIHSGVGKLRGGGITKIYGNHPTIKDYKRKLDHRLGAVLLVCLTTMATILFIYGLYYEQVHSSIVKYIHTLECSIEQSISTTMPPQLISTTNAIMEDSLQVNSESDPHEAEDRIIKEIENGPNMQLDLQSQFHKRRKKEKQEAIIENEPLKVPTESFFSSVPLNADEKITQNELSGYNEHLHSAHIAIWVLAVLNLLAVIMLIPLSCLFHSYYFKAGTSFKAIYRAILILTLIFMSAQLLYLFDPLFSSSIQFPHIVDRLFVNGLPRPIQLLEPMEQTFACVFFFHEVLVHYKIQEPCVPKIKDYLLPTYTVVLLILIDLFPFLFAIFTYLWDAKIKEWKIIRQARHRVELNKKKRPQSREQIVSHTLSSGQSGSSANY